MLLLKVKIKNAIDGAKLDRTLTFRRHLKSLHQKLTSRIELLRRLVGSSWGVATETLHTAALALVHSTAECCASTWCRNKHTHLIDKPINDALRAVTGFLRPISTDNLLELTR